MNRIETKVQNKKILSIYFSWVSSIKRHCSNHSGFRKTAVGMIEIGLPLANPLADGPTIQESSFYFCKWDDLTIII
jgi:tryptophan synthase alpha subunit